MGDEGPDEEREVGLPLHIHLCILLRSASVPIIQTTFETIALTAVATISATLSKL